ncbi:ATP synthase subunit C lysine N-methyltransferase isoform X2 [Aphelocoma coerulescens]|uniref:ATP synthase subunit C lysine N-methyltransferase isoform X2 n=1 Tax=Aphelocoma coerulescens TaxID=39617 RepID=UPI00360455AD
MSQAVAKEIPQEQGEGGSRGSSWGLLVTAGVGGTLVALYAVATPFVTPALRKVCLPFVPATAAQIQNVLKMLENRSGSLVDIGSGDGRIVIAAAKKGFQAVGYELNPWLVWYSRYRAWRDGVHQNTKFHISDLWKVSFSHYTNVVVFGVPQMDPFRYWKTIRSPCSLLFSMLNKPNSVSLCFCIACSFAKADAR